MKGRRFSSGGSTKVKPTSKVRQARAAKKNETAKADAQAKRPVPNTRMTPEQMKMMLMKDQMRRRNGGLDDVPTGDKMRQIKERMGNSEMDRKMREALERYEQRKSGGMKSGGRVRRFKEGGTTLRDALFNEHVIGDESGRKSGRKFDRDATRRQFKKLKYGYPAKEDRNVKQAAKINGDGRMRDLMEAVKTGKPIPKNRRTIYSIPEAKRRIKSMTPAEKARYLKRFTGK